MIGRLVPLAIVLALLVPATASAEVTIKVGSDKYRAEKYREQLYPGGFRIKGKTGDFRGQVQIEVDEFPYGSFVDGGTAATNDKGEYVFSKVAPTRNAMVRVRAGNERSKTIELFVHPGVKWKDSVTSKGRLKVSYTYIGHPGFAPPSNAFFVYIKKTKESKLRRVGGPLSMTQVGDGRWRHQGTHDLPSSSRAYSFYTLFCTKGLSAAGYGRTWPIDSKCGQKVVK